ncbi:MAG TPA: hypothetical protein VH643_12210 [Gemmataceae bacterium]|jgi:hypothetical protein
MDAARRRHSTALGALQSMLGKLRALLGAVRLGRWSSVCRVRR